MAKKKKTENEEASEEIVEAKPSKTKKLLASEWARQHGVPALDFVWWDTNDGLIDEEQFNKIKKQVGR